MYNNNNKEIITEQDIMKGASMIMSNEVSKFTSFCINITKDDNAKRSNKVPMVRIRTLAYLISAGLLQNGYIEGYEISNIVEQDPELIKKFDSEVVKKTNAIDKEIKELQSQLDLVEQDSDEYNDIVSAINKLQVSRRNVKYDVKKNLASQVRRELSNIEKLGYFKTYQCKIEDCTGFPYRENETYKEYARRLKQAKKNNMVNTNVITSRVYRYTYLTRDFYNKAKAEGIVLDYIPTNREIAALDATGVEFKNKSRKRKSIIYNSTVIETVYATGKVETEVVDSNPILTDLIKEEQVVEEVEEVVEETIEDPEVEEEIEMVEEIIETVEDIMEEVEETFPEEDIEDICLELSKNTNIGCTRKMPEVELKGGRIFHTEVNDEPEIEEVEEIEEEDNTNGITMETVSEKMEQLRELQNRTNSRGLIIEINKVEKELENEDLDIANMVNRLEGLLDQFAKYEANNGFKRSSSNTGIRRMGNARLFR